LKIFGHNIRKDQDKNHGNEQEVVLTTMVNESIKKI
jgi:hypothetical protein